MSCPLRNDRYVGSPGWLKSYAAWTKSGGGSEAGGCSGELARDDWRLLERVRRMAGPDSEPLDDDDERLRLLR